MLNQQLMKNMQLYTDALVGIDRISLKPQLGTTNNVGKYKKVVEIRKILPTLGPLAKVKHTKKASIDVVVVRFFGHDQRHFLTIAAGVYSGEPYVHVVLNPSKLTAEAWSHIEHISKASLGQSLNTLLSASAVAKIEFFIDLLGVKPNELMPISTRHLPRYDFLGKNSPTTYLGRRSNATSLAYYDKRQELKDHGGSYLESPLTRFELRRHGKGLTLRDMALAKLTNPFDKAFFLVTPAALQKVCASYSCFPGMYQVINQTRSLASFNPQARKLVKKQLSDVCVAAWRPVQYWANIVAMLQQFFPDLATAPQQHHCQ